MFGGGASHDVEYRQEHVNWWKEELPTSDEVQNAIAHLEAVDYKVDVILTHDVFESHPLTSRYSIDMNRYGQEYANIQNVLEFIEAKTDYKIWFHGHFHEDQDCTTPSGKPCVTLYERVLPLNDFIELED